MSHLHLELGHESCCHHCTDSHCEITNHKKQLIILLISGAAFAAGLVINFALGQQTLAVGFYLIAIISGASENALKAVSSLKNKHFDINVLMLVALIGAIGIGEWTEGAAIAFLFAISNELEERTSSKVRDNLRHLMASVPEEALVYKNQEFVNTPLDKIVIGDLVLVKPGQKIAVDGIIEEGSSCVDQSPITGETNPAEKEPGETVFAGTFNHSGSLLIKVTKKSADSTFAKIIHLVESAQREKAPTQRIVEKFAYYYTPAVIISAVLVSLIPPLFFNLNWLTWFYRALALLLIACPCALVISTPVAAVCAIGNAGRHGVLIKGGKYLEAFARIKAIAFDKTGTLTTGLFKVNRIQTKPGFEANTILAIAAGLEKHSAHPLAKAIIRQAEIEEVKPWKPETNSFRSLTGSGLKGIFNGITYYLGSPRFFEKKGLKPTLPINKNETTVLLGTDQEIIGLIGFTDTLRKNAVDALKKLKQNGIQKIILLTGDHKNAARKAASSLGIDHYLAELLPEEKTEQVKKLGEHYGSVGMVGDGINDAPALAQATVGIAMGTGGSDTALETADIALISNDLSKLAYTLKLSNSTRQIIKQNIFLAVFIKLAAAVLVITGWFSLWMAVLADMGTTLLVTLNATRLLVQRPKKQKRVPE